MRRDKEWNEGQKIWTEKNTERFWSKVKKTKTCWLWRATLSDSEPQVRVHIRKSVPYGSNTGLSKTFPAQYVAWRLAGRSSPGANSLVRKCHNIRCVRPGHCLELSKSEQGKFMVKRKKRLLTPAQVRFLRKSSWKKGDGKIWANKFKVSPMTISNVRSGHTYADV